MEKVYIALKGLDSNIVHDLMHDAQMKELCHLSYPNYGEELGDEEWDATVVPMQEMEDGEVPTLWMNGEVRALVSKEDLTPQQTLPRDFRLSMVRTTPYNSEMSADEMTLYDAILCSTEAEKRAVFDKFPTRAIVAVAMDEDNVRVAPVKGIDWYAAGEDATEHGEKKADGKAGSHTDMDAARNAIYAAIDIVRARRAWDEAHENPLPKLFVDKRPKREGNPNTGFKPQDE